MSPIIYLHGVPGSICELDLFGKDRYPAVFALDRNAITHRANKSAQMVAAIDRRYPNQAVRLAAFSLGIRPALDLAAKLGERVTSLDLVSPAAPMTIDDRDMAGYPVFKLAQRLPQAFGVLALVQAVMARRAPVLLFASLFRSTRGADVVLSKTPTFQRQMTNVLADCCSDGGRNYDREIRAYVAPWSEVLIRVRQPVIMARHGRQLGTNCDVRASR